MHAQEIMPFLFNSSGKSVNKNWKSHSSSLVIQFSAESKVAIYYLNEGGIYSGDSIGGNGWPDIAISIKCIAKINSSAVSFPSWSMSERFLLTKRSKYISCFSSSKLGEGCSWRYHHVLLPGSDGAVPFDIPTQRMLKIINHGPRMRKVVFKILLFPVPWGFFPS